MKDIARLVLVLTLICVASAAALSQVYRITKGPIAESKARELQEAIGKVLPEFDNQPDQDVYKTEGEDARAFYIGKMGDKVVGAAFLVSSEEGYSGHIGALVGVNADSEMFGLEVLDQKETPGLGTRITEPEFIEQMIFTGAAGGERRTLENTDWKVKKEGGDIDQITGATITPRALAGAVKEGLDEFEAVKSVILKDTGKESVPETMDEPAKETGEECVKTPAEEVQPDSGAVAEEK